MSSRRSSTKATRRDKPIAEDALLVWRLHDLRRSVVTHMAEIGIQAPMATNKARQPLSNLQEKKSTRRTIDIGQGAGRCLVNRLDIRKRTEGHR
jgi:hypothetical protein